MASIKKSFFWNNIFPSGMNSVSEKYDAFDSLFSKMFKGALLIIMIGYKLLFNCSINFQL